MAALRVVQNNGVDPDAGADQTIGEALEAMMARVIAEKPTILMLIYEAGGELKTISLPQSPFVMKILAAEAYAALYPDRDVES